MKTNTFTSIFILIETTRRRRFMILLRRLKLSKMLFYFCARVFLLSQCKKYVILVVIE